MEKIQIEDLYKIIQSDNEGANLEFKEAKSGYDNDKIYRYCVALGNEGGGLLILGVSDKKPRRIVGTTACNDVTKFAQKLFNKLKIRVNILDYELPDGRIVIFDIPSRPRGTAFNFEGSYLMRSGDELVSMSEDRLRTIFSEGKPDWLSEISKNELVEQDIIQFLETQSYFDLVGLPYPSNRLGVIERLEKEKFIVKDSGYWAITNLGAVLFAKKMEDFPSVSRKSVRVVVYEDESKLKTRIDKIGSKGYASGFEGLIEFILNQLPRNEAVSATFRQEHKAYPDEAIRELVANALIHQDFNESGTSVIIEIFSDRIEISNPGKPFISLDRFIDDYQSRNEKLADIMRRMRICEEKGSGIDRVIFNAEFFQLPAPDFRVTERRTTSILYSYKDFELMDKSARVRAAFQHCVLQYVTNKRMSNKSLRERFKLPETKAETISRIIRDAVDLEKVKLEDIENNSRRYAKYIPYWA